MSSWQAGRSAAAIQIVMWSSALGAKDRSGGSKITGNKTDAKLFGEWT